MADFLDRILARALPYPQGTRQWLNARTCMLTASDVGAALGTNPYMTRTDLIRHKAGLEPRCVFGGFVAHGHKYEDEAAEAYAMRTGRMLVEMGLVQHATYSWLGASPDRITLCGRAVEIKCPVTRGFERGEPIPPYYMDQMQLQMEVLDLDVCDFVQYKPKGKVIRIDEVARDPDWWRRARPSLAAFWAKVLDIRADHCMQAWEEGGEVDAEGAGSADMPVE